MSEDTDRIKRLAIVALFSDDKLVDRLVLKGGNALSLAYGIIARASFDLDFSMQGEFAFDELNEVSQRIAYRLQQAFGGSPYIVFDVKLEPRPENVTPNLADFWGGYALEFKVIPRDRHDELGGDLAAIRREAVPARPGGKARFEIDISRHEYCVGKQPVEIDQFTAFVYTPTMVVCEKIRALCQQVPEYADFVKNHPAPRARDFFDIDVIQRHFSIDLFTPENLTLLRAIFQAKRVPLSLLAQVEHQREFHRQDWDAVRDTVDVRVRLKEFDEYFDSGVELCRKLTEHLR